MTTNRRAKRRLQIVARNLRKLEILRMAMPDDFKRSFMRMTQDHHHQMKRFLSSAGVDLDKMYSYYVETLKKMQGGQ